MREFRVVWKRDGQRQKIRRYSSRTGALRRLNLLTSDEPWKWYSKPRNPDDYYCCPGGPSWECGCGGQTVRQFAQRFRDDLPELEYARIDSRKISEWETEIVAQTPCSADMATGEG